jgi:hypothetical protein
MLLRTLPRHIPRRKGCIIQSLRAFSSSGSSYSYQFERLLDTNVNNIETLPVPLLSNTLDAYTLFFSQ